MYITLHTPHHPHQARRSGATGLLLSATLLVAAQCKSSDPPADNPPPPKPPDLAQDLASGEPPIDPNLQYDSFWLQKSVSDFTAWKLNGVSVTPAGAGATVQLVPSKGPPLNCQSDDIDGGTARFDAPTGLCAGSEPMVSGLPAGVNYYSGGPFYFGTLVSPEVAPKSPIDHLIASWNAATPKGTWLQVHVRVKLASGWTGWYRLPIWASDFDTIKRHSVNVPADQNGGVDTDTFYLDKVTATAYQLGITLFTAAPTATPTLRLVAAIASKDMNDYPSVSPNMKVWGTNLAVPQRSQELPEYKNRDMGMGFGGGGEVWCSPTSTSMVMEYWSKTIGQSQLNQTVPAAAAGCYDWVYDGTGNWPFNTAYAATFGLTGFITRLYAMGQVEPWIKAGVPVVISIAFKAGELPGAPISESNGHLIVVRGFDASGDVICNDPAAKTNDAVQLVYKRAALEAAWAHSNRTVYIMYPANWGDSHPLPAQ